MGQGNAIGLARDTIRSEQFLKFQEAHHRVVHRAFAKCVDPASCRDPNATNTLLPEEQACVEEYALLYSTYASRNFLYSTSLYEQHERDMYQKARMEMMQQQARQDLKAH